MTFTSINAIIWAGEKFIESIIGWNFCIFPLPNQNKMINLLFNIIFTQHFWQILRTSQLHSPCPAQRQLSDYIHQRQGSLSYCLGKFHICAFPQQPASLSPHDRQPFCTRSANGVASPRSLCRRARQIITTTTHIIPPEFKET